jgi:hypothetical protein
VAGGSDVALSFFDAKAKMVRLGGVVTATSMTWPCWSISFHIDARFQDHRRCS